MFFNKFLLLAEVTQKEKLELKTKCYKAYENSIQIDIKSKVLYFLGFYFICVTSVIEIQMKAI